jgi:addiction module RelB/DinJ family antitoxin
MLQVRVDGKIKEKAGKAFVAMGLDLSSGVRLYLTHVARTKTIPYTMLDIDNFIREQKIKPATK